MLESLLVKSLVNIKAYCRGNQGAQSEQLLVSLLSLVYVAMILRTHGAFVIGMAREVESLEVKDDNVNVALIDEDWLQHPHAIGTIFQYSSILL
jgi:hypothetical protein